MKNENIKQKLLNDLENYLGDDISMINHLKEVMGFAEKILKEENGDWDIIIPASILHDVGTKVVKEKYFLTTAHRQEKEGSKLAREILLKNEIKKEDIDEICEIIAHHHSPKRIETLNFKVLYDADYIVNLKYKVNPIRKVVALVFSFSNWIVKPLFGSFVLFNAEFFSVVNMENKLKLEKIINKVFLTGAGKKIAKKVYL